MSLKKLLERSGLTKYQQELFITIIKNPGVDAKTLSKISKVPLGRIYTELDSLNNLSLIDIVKDRSKKYFIESPRTKILMLIQNEKDKLELLEKEALGEFVNFGQKSAEVFTLSSEIKQSQIDSFRWAKEEVLQCFGPLHKSNENRELRSIYEKEIVLAVKRGVQFKALYHKGSRPPVMLKELNEEYPNRFKIRLSQNSLPRFEVVDSNQILLKIHDPSDTSSTMSTIVINNVPLAKKLRSSFINMWKQSK